MVTNLVLGCSIRIYLDGIVNKLEGYEQFNVLASTDDEQQLISVIQRNAVGIVLLDLGMPESIQLLRTIRSAQPGCDIIALSFSNQREQLLACAKAQVAGFVSCHDTLQDLVRCVFKVRGGERYFTHDLTESLFACLQEAAPESRPQWPKQTVGLTQRQTHVLQLLEKGYSNKQIARTLGIEVATVKNHVHSVLQKLQVQTRCEAAAYYRRQTPQTSSLKAPELQPA